MDIKEITASNETEVVCNHKPGDVWADGCCTSKKSKTTKDASEAEQSETENTNEPSVTTN